MTSSHQLQRHQYASQPQANIWTEMSYTPPSGPCKQKLGLMASCTCFRFMVHPLKAATTFDCDGCGHHASFHKFVSPEEEEIMQARREGRLSHGGLAQLDMGTAMHMRLEEQGGGRVVQSIVEGKVLDEEDDDEGEESDDVVEVDVPVRPKRRMITAAPATASGGGVTKSKGKVRFDLGKDEGEKKKEATGRKRKG